MARGRRLGEKITRSGKRSGRRSSRSSRQSKRPGRQLDIPWFVRLMVKRAVKRPEATGTARNDESPPCRSRYVDDRACEDLIWDHGKRLSRCLAGGPSAEAWSVSRRKIGDARQGLAASLVIFWAFLGILASAAGRATERLAPMVNLRARPIPQTGDEDGERECRAGRSSACGDSQPNKKPASLAVFSVFGSSRGPWSGPVL